MYKKEKEEIKRVYDVTLALKEGGFLSSRDFHIRGGIRAFLGMGGEALGNLILLHCSSLV